MGKVLIAMSGGVDSSVAAYLMGQLGWDCLGATMTLYRNEDIGISRSRTCCSLEDVEDARSVANRLGMPYYVFNFSNEFRCQVMDRFAAAYDRLIVQMSSKGTVRWPSRRLRRTGSTPSTTPARVM